MLVPIAAIASPGSPWFGEVIGSAGASADPRLLTFQQVIKNIGVFAPNDYRTLLGEKQTDSRVQSTIHAGSLSRANAVIHMFIGERQLPGAVFNRRFYLLS